MADPTGERVTNEYENRIVTEVNGHDSVLLGQYILKHLHSGLYYQYETSATVGIIITDPDKFKSVSLAKVDRTLALDCTGLSMRQILSHYGLSEFTGLELTLLRKLTDNNKNVDGNLE